MISFDIITSLFLSDLRFTKYYKESHKLFEPRSTKVSQAIKNDHIRERKSDRSVNPSTRLKAAIHRPDLMEILTKIKDCIDI